MMEGGCSAALEDKSVSVGYGLLQDSVAILPREAEGFCISYPVHLDAHEVGPLAFVYVSQGSHVGQSG